MRCHAVEVRVKDAVNTTGVLIVVVFRSEPHVNIEIVDYFTKLVIRPVSRANSGQYTVSAVNSSGKDTATINVTVTDKPTPPVGPLQVCNRRFRCVRDRVFYISCR